MTELFMVRKLRAVFIIGIAMVGIGILPSTTTSSTSLTTVMQSPGHQGPGADASRYQMGTVYLDKGSTPRFVPGLMDKSKGAAYGYFNDTLLQSGWGILEIKAGYGTGSFTDAEKMFAAGFLEGVLTAQQIWNHYVNMKPVFLKDPSSMQSKQIETKLRTFFQKQEKWTTNMITKHGKDDPYWRHVSYVMAHIDGLFEGYRSAANPKWEADRFVVQFLNAVGDLIDLIRALEPSTRLNFHNMTHGEIRNFVQTSGRCSALVKVTGAYEDLFMSHSSWFVYQGTNRIYKHYHFNVRDDKTASKAVSFSSYPGFLESLDDFYLLSSRMVLLQTTNNIFDTKLYDLVQPESLLAWQRVRLANMMAANGSQWNDYFKQHNSGTYNNQYMVIDLKQVQQRKEIFDGALWVVEQIPGLVVGADQTSILRAGYWPSYNVPFYEDIYKKSGYPEIVKLKGTDMSYQLAPRAKIFRRDQAKVVDMDTMKAIMRYNDYKVDPYSEGDSCNTICCRGDLRKGTPAPNGCYDTKVSDLSMALRQEAHIINGPTRSSGLPAFKWVGAFANTPHVGLPDTYNFTWIRAQPDLD